LKDLSLKVTIPTEDLDISQLSLDSPGRPDQSEQSTDLLQAIFKESVKSVNTGLTETRKTIENNKQIMQTSLNLLTQ